MIMAVLSNNTRGGYPPPPYPVSISLEDLSGERSYDRYNIRKIMLSIILMDGYSFCRKEGKSEGGKWS